MRLGKLLGPDPYNRAVARVIAAVSTEAGCVVLQCRETQLRQAVLDRAAAELASLRCRVVRVAANEPDELSLRDLVAQLTRQLGADAGPGDTLEQIHRLLTETDASCDCIALMIDHAHLLQASALRFLQLTSRSGPNLKIVLASNGATATACAPEFRSIQSQSTCIDLNLPTDPACAPLERGPQPDQTSSELTLDRG